jgi:hypothetical protein
MTLEQPWVRKSLNHRLMQLSSAEWQSEADYLIDFFLDSLNLDLDASKYVGLFLYEDEVELVERLGKKLHACLINEERPSCAAVPRLAAVLADKLSSNENSRRT